MTTQNDIVHTSGAYYAYFGERGDWPIVVDTCRDADCLTRSNFRVAQRLLADWPDDCAVERSSHWAAGWVEYLLVRPGTEAAAEAGRIRERLAEYPILDGADYSDLEYGEAKVTCGLAVKDFTQRSIHDYPCDDIAPFVWRAAADPNGDDWWPAPSDVRSGLLAWARNVRHGITP